MPHEGSPEPRPSPEGAEVARRALVARLRASDPSAFREVLRAHGDTLYGFLFRLARRKDVADDLFQETWLTLAEFAPRLAEDTRIEAWLFTVARNAYRSHRRWAWMDVSRFLLQADPGTHDPGPAPSPEEDLGSRRAMRDLDRALATLSADDREILLLTAVDGLAHDEVAKLLGVSADAHRKRLSRARKTLADALRVLQNEKTRP
ncbi:MAG: sigma-70 family RNA polymerase sigma factor [Polyangiaceae bacterium]